MIILYFADLICDVSYAIIAVCLFFRKFHLLTASFYTTLIVLLISTFFFCSYVTLLIKFTWEFKQMCVCPLIICVFTYLPVVAVEKFKRVFLFERSRFVFKF